MVLSVLLVGVGVVADFLLGSPQSYCFHAAAVHVRGHGVRLTDMTAQVMAVYPGDPVWVMPLDW